MIRSVVVAALLLLGVTAAQASTITLLEAGDSDSIGGAMFTLNPTDSSTGSGTFDSFLRIGTAGRFGNEFGMNTTDVPGNTKMGGFLETALLLSNVGTSVGGGATYYEFLLDANEFNSTPSEAQLDLVGFQVFLAAAPDLASTDLLGIVAPAYDLDAGADNTVVFSTLGGGSGEADLQVLVPLASANPESTYVYVFAAFARAGDGFEEWSVRTAGEVPPPPLPEPGTALLLGAGLIGLASFRAR